ncbi:MAG: response regulator transcription factor [Pseudomonadota bacterium]
MSAAAETKLLIVEDDVGIGRMLERGLGAHGFAVDWARDLRTATDAIRANAPDLIILDRMLPDGDGAALCSAIRKSGSQVPICMLTARETLDDKLRGFDAGADDYVVKPFEFDELLARLHVMLRRVQAAAAPAEPRLDDARRILEVENVSIDFTRREWPLLKYLLEHEGTDLSRETLIEHVWGTQDDVTLNSVDVYVGYLRKKLSTAAVRIRIETVRGVGFRLIRY